MLCWCCLSMDHIRSRRSAVPSPLVQIVAGLNRGLPISHLTILLNCKLRWTQHLFLAWNYIFSAGHIKKKKILLSICQKNASYSFLLFHGCVYVEVYLMFFQSDAMDGTWIRIYEFQTAWMARAGARDLQVLLDLNKPHPHAWAPTPLEALLSLTTRLFPISCPMTGSAGYGF